MSKVTGRTAVFIDGNSTYYAVKTLGFDMDYRRLLDWLEEEFSPLLRVTYYTTVSDEENVHQDIIKLLDFLQYNGFTVERKPVKMFDNEDKQRKRGDIAVDISVDMLLAMPHVDNMVIFSGDSNLKKAIQAVQAHGCRVSIVSTNESTPRVVADELRRISDEFIEMADVEDLFKRVVKPAAAVVNR